MIEFLPLVALFKIFNFLSTEERLAISHVCMRLARAIIHYKTRRGNDTKAVRIYTVYKTNDYCHQRPMRKQLCSIYKDIGKGTKHIRHLTVDIGLSKTGFRRHHKLYTDTLIHVCKNIKLFISVIGCKGA